MSDGESRSVWMFRAVLIACGVLVAGIVALYARPSEVQRADFAYVNSSDLNTLDPAMMTWKQDIRVALNIWEGLATYHPETSAPIEGAALPPDVSTDGLTYTFQIRPDARWSNGDSVTAADFVRGWRRAIEPGTAGDYAFFITDYVAGAREYYQWRTAAVARATSWPGDSNERRTFLAAHAAEMDDRFAPVGIHAVGAKQLVVELSRPCAYFRDLCAFATLLPVHESIELLREKHDGVGLTNEGLVVYDPQWTKPEYHANGYPGLITNGPYVPRRWEFKRRLRLEANPFFRDRDRLGCRMIDMLVYGDLNTAIMAYEAGDLDFLPEMDVSYDHELARLALSGERPDFKSPDVYGVYFYLFNCADATVNGQPNPFVDARVRRAFALAVDKQAICRNVAGRGESPTGNAVPVGTIPGYSSPNGLTSDPDEARRLLAEAGYPDGAGLPAIDLLYNTGFHHHAKVCDAMAEMWRRELGATVILRGKEVKTFAEDRKNRRFMIARGGWYGDYLDPTTFLDLFATDNGNNDAGMSDPAYDELLRRAALETDGSRRLTLLSEAEERVVRDSVPILPLYQYTQLLAIKPRVGGLFPNARLMFPFRYLTVR